MNFFSIVDAKPTVLNFFNMLLEREKSRSSKKKGLLCFGILLSLENETHSGSDTRLNLLSVMHNCGK